MKILKIETISDQVKLFMHKQGYNEILLANELDVFPQELSRRIDADDWNFDLKRGLKRIFATRGYELVGNVKQKVKINWNESN